MQQTNKIKIMFLLLILLAGSFFMDVSAAEKRIENMNFKGADINDVLRAVAKAATINLIVDGSVKGLMTINLKDISFKKAFKLITQSHGLAYKWDGNTVVVAAPERIKEIYGKIDTETVKIKYADFEKTKKMISSVYPDLKVYINRDNGKLVIVGDSQSIIKAVALTQEIDAPYEQLTEVKERIIKTVKYRTENPESLINNLNLIYPQLKIGTNIIKKELVLYGEAKVIKKAVELLKKLDSPPGQRTNITRIVKIQFGQPETIKEKISHIMPEIRLELNKSRILITGQKQAVNKAVSLINKLDMIKKDVIRVVQVDHLQLKSIEKTISSISGGVDLNLNKERKKIIIKGQEEDVNRVISLIKQLDIPRKQVIIEARIQEISRTKLSEFGISPDQLSRINFIKEGDDQIKEMELTLPDFIEMLEDEGTADTLACPRLLTLNGERAKLLIGDRVPVKVEKIVDGETISTIEYIDAGISLQFKPWITKKNYIILEVSPRVSSIGETLGNSLPTINTREAETRIRLQDGQTFVIGGLIQNDEIKSYSEVPFLADIPVLGEFFRHQKINNIETELLITITPRIVDDKSRNSGEKAGTAIKSDEKNNRNISTYRESDQVKADNFKELLKTLNEARKKRIYKKKTDSINSRLHLFYTVKSGQTSQDIAGLFGIPVEIINQINDIENKVREGTVLNLEIPAERLYKLSNEETILEVAEKFDLNIDHLQEINNINDENARISGKIIILPQSQPEIHP